LAGAAFAGCTAEPTAALRLGLYSTRIYAPFFLARHLRALDPAQIRIAEYPTASELMLSFQNQALDAIATTLDDALRLASYGHAFKILSVLAFSHGFDALVGGSRVSEVQAIRGKVVGFEANSLGAFLLAKALDRHGIKAGEIILRPWRIDRLNRQLTARVIDAAVTYDPYRSLLLQAGARVIFDSADIPGESCSVLLVRGDALPTHAQALRQVIQGWSEGLRFLQSQGTKAAAAMTGGGHTDVDAFLASMNLLRFVQPGENVRLLGSGEESLDILLSRTAEFMLQYDLLPKPVTVAGLRDNRFLQLPE
jgi:NitT/TauT family transport system substrate-binding protein